jgi:hypothetical protein
MPAAWRGRKKSTEASAVCRSMVSVGRSQVAAASVRVPLVAPVHDNASGSRVKVGLGRGVWVLSGDCVVCGDGAGDVVAVGLGLTLWEAHAARNAAASTASIPKVFRQVNASSGFTGAWEQRHLIKRSTRVPDTVEARVEPNVS